MLENRIASGSIAIIASAALAAASFIGTHLCLRIPPAAAVSAGAASAVAASAAAASAVAASKSAAAAAARRRYGQPGVGVDGFRFVVDNRWRAYKWQYI